ncbi:MAG TPA: glycosyltransferase family 9 protein [Planosporangium sp.]|jgi:ADP-heptose:LPS heptosyltransferase|nr:glycosyltransferase family 9 protein [Planosporangium sp.]
MAERYTDILVVELLGGIGDLLMVLPAVHALARRNRGAALRVLTDEPGADLVRGDPAVTEVLTPRRGRPGAERRAVAEALTARRPDLAITTARYDGIPDLLATCGARCVTDLWRRPPPDERVGDRYLRILYAEGLVGAEDLGAAPRVRLRPAELADGEATIAGLVPPMAAQPPVVFVTDSGMAVKLWPQPHWRRLAATLSRQGHPVLSVTPVSDAPVVALPKVTLRQLAACFRAVARRGGIVVGGDTGPVRLAAAAGARTVGLFGPTLAVRYGIGGGDDLQGLPDCPHRLPTLITEQVCWWDARCPLSPAGPACMVDIQADPVVSAVTRLAHADRRRE